MEAFMETLDYVSLAVSKDAGRINLTGVYRDKTRLVGTDGHRLHLVDGLPEVEKPHYVDGRDLEFPNYETAFLSDAQMLCEFPVVKEDIKRIKALIGLYPKGEYPIAKLAVRAGRLFLESTGNQPGLLFSLSFSVDQKAVEEFEIGINLKYLVDALIPSNIGLMQLSGKPERGIELRHPMYRSMALIMGAKL
jgi:DNA polymerase III sliding clamp (beta) subunit (PCNA family)